MADYYEIDFLEVSPKSGDAITLRYSLNEKTFIHVVDAGFQKDGEMVVKHIKRYYDNPACIDHVVATHNDGDHCGGLLTVLENFKIGTLWIFRPWKYAAQLLPLFKRFQNPWNLAVRLRETYSNLAELEKLALDKGIEVREPFFGQKIGEFRVLSPTEEHFWSMLLESEKTPDQVINKFDESLDRAIRISYHWLSDKWGFEYFSREETSCDNEMSVVQWANFDGVDILLTGDAGRRALRNVIDSSSQAGLILPLKNESKIQVPHHGSRRNVDAFLLDYLLGGKSPKRISPDDMNRTAYVCASGDDDEHPKKAVVRGFMHRGARVFTTENCGWLRANSANAPLRMNSVIATPESYPETQEVD